MPPQCSQSLGVEIRIYLRKINPFGQSVINFQLHRCLVNTMKKLSCHPLWAVNAISFLHPPCCWSCHFIWVYKQKTVRKKSEEQEGCLLSRDLWGNLCLFSIFSKHHVQWRERRIMVCNGLCVVIEWKHASHNSKAGRWPAYGSLGINMYCLDRMND